MTDFLVDHAIKNVWCSPMQDNQVIIRPARLTPVTGVSLSFRLFMTDFTMPEQGRFHLYQIGLVYPSLLSLDGLRERWIRLDELIGREGTLLDLYNIRGIEYPRTLAWVRVTMNRNLVIAIKQHNRVDIDYAKDDLFVRIYQNLVRFDFTDEKADVGAKLEVKGGIPTNTEEILVIQNEYEQKVAAVKASGAGQVYCFCNGLAVPRLSMTTMVAGDTCEWVYDSSIRHVVDFTVDELASAMFTSTVDSRGKYILHLPGFTDDQIFYQDDVDVYLLTTDTEKGVWYHKNRQDALRNLTYWDYSTPTEHVSSFIQQNPKIFDGRRVKIRLMIRDSGLKYGTPDDHYRIKELYKLSDADVLSAMTNLQGVVPFWRADALENSNLTWLMRADPKDIVKELVAETYGYNAISKMIGGIYHRVEATTVGGVTKLFCPVPLIYQVGCTALEHDAQGHLIGWTFGMPGPQYVCAYPNTKYVEFVYGVASETIDEYQDRDNLVIQDKVYDYRFYCAPKTDDLQNKQWFDCTGDGAKYEVVNGVVSWKVMADYFVMVRSNKTPMIRSVTKSILDGLITVDLSNKQLKADGTFEEKDMEVPMGELCVWINGCPAQRSLDYVLDFPKIRIQNKQYLNGSTEVNLVVMSVGLCNKDLSWNDITETGFVYQGRLSVDLRQGVRNDSDLSVTIGGHLRLQDEVVFDEDTITFEQNNAYNGKPFMIRQRVIPMKAFTGVDTYWLRDRSRQVDQVVSDYLTLKIEQQAPQGVNPVQDYHHLYSPFFSKIIYDLVVGTLVAPSRSANYSDQIVLTLLKNYLYLYARDPSHPDNRPNSGFVLIEPHPYPTAISLTADAYALVFRAVKLLAPGLINLSTTIKIG